MSSSKPKLRQRCAACGTVIRRVYPQNEPCACGGSWELFPKVTKLSPTDRLHISLMGHMGLWPKAAIAKAFGVDRKTVDQCMERLPQA